MSQSLGIAAAGHEETANAAARLLKSGGNAFDAALGAMCVACVAEPMLASLGGGGFLMARQPGQAPGVFDFFVQTPGVKKHREDIDFYPILADFGTAQQEFHIGMGSMAVPGMVAGLFECHAQLCRLPIEEVVAPAIELANEGVRISPFQNYISHILKPILDADAQAMRLVACDDFPGQIADAGRKVRNPDLADTLCALLAEGPELFYQGELAGQLAKDCDVGGGMLSRTDLEQYRVLQRSSVRFDSHGAQFAFNSPPSPSGSLIAFALGLLEPFNLSQHRWGHAWHGLALARAMGASGTLRREHDVDLGLGESRPAEILADHHLEQWRKSIGSGAVFSRGTTHISVADSEGNLASLTTSNGEGCSYVLPGTGIMMNNMLGEEDLNPSGFHRWSPGTRLGSMMCPSIAILPDGGEVALGSGGSNRIRSALLQVLVNMFEFDMELKAAVHAPRIHLEGKHLSIENGFDDDALEALRQEWPDHHHWPEPNMFFGGVHAVERLADGRFRGAGDPRRGGVAVLAEN